MRSIIIFRHGKSDWDAIYDRDHNRPLSKRGVKASKKMGRNAAEGISKYLNEKNKKELDVANA